MIVQKRSRRRNSGGKQVDSGGRKGPADQVGPSNSKDKGPAFVGDKGKQIMVFNAGKNQ